MHIFTLFFPTLASFLLPIAAGPIALPDPAIAAGQPLSQDSPVSPGSNNNKPVCTGTTIQGGKNVSMQSFCVDTVGAMCMGVLNFPDTVQSGNPYNCGNACSCKDSQCPLAPPNCQDISCQGDSKTGCTFATLTGCYCTGVSYMDAVTADPNYYYSSSSGSGGAGSHGGWYGCPPDPVICSECGGQDSVCVTGAYKGCPCR